MCFKVCYIPVREKVVSFAEMLMCGSIEGASLY